MFKRNEKGWIYIFIACNIPVFDDTGGVTG
jgi:hypothetical protein